MAPERKSAPLLNGKAALLNILFDLGSKRPNLQNRRPVSLCKCKIPKRGIVVLDC
jgi:hypothetical protein